LKPILDRRFDFISPFSYLQSELLHALSAYLRGDAFFQSGPFNRARTLPQGIQRIKAT
jgi:hypothetical protein